MSAQLEEANVADSARLFSRPLLEAILLSIRDGFETEGKCPDDNPNDICCLAKGWLRYLKHVWTVENGHRKRDGPDPEHLEDPESKEREELVALVVEAVIFASLQNSE